MWINFLYGIRILAKVSFVLSQLMRLQDGRTDGFLGANTRLHRCGAVKKTSSKIAVN